MKLLRILVAAAVIFGISQVYKKMNPEINAKTLAAEINSKATFPKQIGNGVRLDGINDEKGALVYKFTLTDFTAPNLDNTTYKLLKAGAKLEMCAFLTNEKVREAIKKADLQLVQNFYNQTGAFVLSVDARQRDCS